MCFVNTETRETGVAWTCSWLPKVYHFPLYSTMTSGSRIYQMPLVHMSYTNKYYKPAIFYNVPFVYIMRWKITAVKIILEVIYYSEELV